MRKIVFGAGIILVATSASWAQNFNPGTVVGNVFQDPASGCGCGVGHGCCPPQSYAGQHSRAYPYDRHKRVARHSAGANTNH